MPPEEIDVDSLLNEIESPSEGIPMESSEGPAAAVEPVSQQFDFGQFEFDWNGQKVRPDSFDKAKTWMQQGYNYSQRAADLNKRQTEFDQRATQFDQRTKHYSRFDEVDKFVKENPQWWEHVEQSWNTRSQHGQPQIDPNLEPYIRPLQEELSQVKSFVGELQQERQQLLEARQQETILKEDQALDTEIESIRSLYPNIDFNAVGEDGRTLEQRILGHAQEIGTNSFRAATRDYLHDQLVQSAKANSLSAEARTKQIQAKKGILSTSPTPRKSVEAATNVRGKSYDQLTQDALRELGIA